MKSKNLVILDRTLFAACFHADFLLGLFFDPEDGGDMFYRNAGLLSMEYTALYPTAVRTSNSTREKSLAPVRNVARSSVCTVAGYIRILNESY
jgi:hypothetical protein